MDPVSPPALGGSVRAGGVPTAWLACPGCAHSQPFCACDGSAAGPPVWWDRASRRGPRPAHPPGVRPSGPRRACLSEAAGSGQQRGRAAPARRAVTAPPRGVAPTGPTRGFSRGLQPLASRVSGRLPAVRREQRPTVLTAAVRSADALRGDVCGAQSTPSTSPSVRPGLLGRPHAGVGGTCGPRPAPRPLPSDPGPPGPVWSWPLLHSGRGEPCMRGRLKVLLCRPPSTLDAAPHFLTGLVGKPQADSALVPSRGQGGLGRRRTSGPAVPGGCAHRRRPGSGPGAWQGGWGGDRSTALLLPGPPTRGGRPLWGPGRGGLDADRELCPRLLFRAWLPPAPCCGRQR